MLFISHAQPTDLDTILDSDKVHVVSPFLSAKTISRISDRRHKAFKLITRLPTSYNFPSAFIENDPKPLLDAMQRMGSKFKVYALPPVHAKIYINESSSWMGSANFTVNGFSGKPETLIDFEKVQPELSQIFRTYLGQSTLITIQNLKALIGWIDEGLTEVSRYGGSKGSQDEPEAAGASYESFVAWLRTYRGVHKRDAKVLLNRAEGGNQMSGHVAIAFNGVTSFLRKNPGQLPKLLANKTGYPGPEVMQPMAHFIKQHGDLYQGPRGGKWRNYLSTDLGGRQTGGGAGNVIVRRALILIPSYLRDRSA